MELFVCLFPITLADETLPVDAHSTPIMDDAEDEDCIEEDEEYPDEGVDELEPESTVHFTLQFMHRSLYKVDLLHDFLYRMRI